MNKFFKLIISYAISLLITLFIPLMTYIGHLFSIDSIIYIFGTLSLLYSVCFFLPRILAFKFSAIIYVLMLIYMSFTIDINHTRYEVLSIVFSIGLAIYMIVESFWLKLPKKNIDG